MLILSVPKPEEAGMNARQKLEQLDPLGTLLFLPAIICLVLALQWGQSYAWNDGRVIALLVVFGVLAIGFVAAQIWKQETATIPPRILKQRSIASGACYSACVGAAMLVFIYYLPIWFQAIKGVSAVKSGIMTLPLVLALVFGSIVAGGLITAIGYYTPFMIASAITTAVGAGLLTTLKPDTTHPKWIGYQVILGFGIGLGMQQSGTAAQTSLANARKDVPVGVSLMFFSQSLGGAIFIAVAQNVFASKLVSGLAAIVGAAGVDPAAVLQTTGATNLRSVIPADSLGAVLAAYNKALTTTYYVGVAMACFSILPALTMEWRSVKKARKHASKEEEEEQVDTKKEAVVDGEGKKGSSENREKV